MATSTHSLATRHYTLPTLWHLLSLDAPTVAALWCALAVHAAHLPLHLSDVAALALGTWMLYAVDRILDARHGALHLQEERHHFHGLHHIAFLSALVCAIPVLLLLLMPMEAALLHAYLWLGVAMASYFALIHLRRRADRMPKELAVGIVFTAAVFMPEIQAGMLPALLPHAACFGALCWLNCTMIYEREHTSLREAHWSTRLVIRHTAILLAALICAGIALVFTAEESGILGAGIALSALAMLALHSQRHRIDRLPFRIAADAALLTPLFLLR